MSPRAFRTLFTLAGAAAALLPCLAAVAQKGAAAKSPTARPAAAAEWPQWRGPDRTGRSAETGILKSWPAEGPKLVFRADGLGGGYGTPSVAAGRLYGMGYRGEEEAVWARDARTGEQVWSTVIASANRRVGYGDGSRCTPTVDGARLYAIGVSGDLVCLEAATGKLVWQKNFVNDFGGRVPRWGFSESPLVDGEKVIATPGGPGAAIVALNKATGEVIWKAAVPEGDSAHYSSAIAVDMDGQRQYIQFLAGGVVGVSARDGRFLWRYNNPANRTANISTVIYRDRHVFAATAYNTGGGLVKLTSSPQGVAAEEVYFTRQMMNHHGGMILVGDHLYGFDGANLTCLEFLTGTVKWTNRSVGKGSLVYADGHFIARGERGPIALVEANPNEYVEKGRFDQPERSSKNAWPHPVVAGGRLYLRDQDVLLCYDLKGQ